MARPRLADGDGSVSLFAEVMYLNGEAIELLHQPAAPPDSELFAFFRRSDVVGRGDVLDTRSFPSSTSNARKHPGSDRGAQPPRRSGRALVPL